MDSKPRKPHSCFIKENDIEAGISGEIQRNHHSLLYRSLPNQSGLQPNLRNTSFSSVSSPRSLRFSDGRFEERKPHFLDFCTLCRKPLGQNRDIYMYQGDVPFCSEECRQEQIDADEAEEKNVNATKSKSIRKKEVRRSSSPNKNYPFHSGAVIAA